MEKICENCSYMRLLTIRKGYKAYCCMAHSVIKGGVEHSDPKGVMPHFKCNCGKFVSKE